MKSRLRHVWRFASVFSRPMDSRRLPTVPVDSSQAKRPLPGSTMAFAVWTSSSAYFSRLICGAAARGALRCCVENVFVGTSADAGALRAKARMADFIVDLRCAARAVRGAIGDVGFYAAVLRPRRWRAMRRVPAAALRPARMSIAIAYWIHRCARVVQSA